MKTLNRLFLAVLLFPALLFGAANDIRVGQVNPAGTAWVDRIMAPASGGAFTTLSGYRTAIGLGTSDSPVFTGLTANSLTANASSNVTISTVTSDKIFSVTTVGTQGAYVFGDIAGLSNIWAFHNAAAVPGVSPPTPLDLIIQPRTPATNGWSGITITSIGGYAAGVWPYTEFLQANGTLAVPTATITGDYVGELAWIGHNGTGYRLAADIKAVATGTNNASSVSSKLEFLTPNGVATLDLTKPNMVLDANGLAIGTNTVVPTGASLAYPLDLYAAVSGGATVARVRNNSTTGVAEWRALNDGNSRYAAVGMGGSARTDILANAGYIYNSAGGIAIVTADSSTLNIAFGGSAAGNVKASITSAGLLTLSSSLTLTDTTLARVDAGGGLGGILSTTSAATTTTGFQVINSTTAGAAAVTLNNSGASGHSFTFGSAGSASGLTAAQSKFFVYDNTAGAVVMIADTTGVTFSGTVTKTGGTYLLQTSTALTDSAAAQLGTLTNAPTAGNPTKWIAINDNGTSRKIPAW